MAIPFGDVDATPMSAGRGDNYQSGIMEQTIKAIMLGLDADIEGMDPECLRTLSNTFILCT